MLHIFDTDSAKKPARVLEKILQELGISTTHGQALNILGRMAGFKDWNAANAELESVQQLDSMELEHARDNADNRYGPECALRAHTGFELRYDAEEETPSYVRVCDPQGREVAYWVSEEWRGDPEMVMGAILGALVRGRPIDIDEKGKGVGTAAPAPHQPCVFDVPLDRLFRVVEEGEGNGGGFCRVMDVIDADVLAWRTASDVLQDEDVSVAAVYSLVDDMPVTFNLCVGDIRPLVWEAEKRCFVNRRTGNTWRFLLSEDFGSQA
jgi:hypothetical protein